MVDPSYREQQQIIRARRKIRTDSQISKEAIRIMTTKLPVLKAASFHMQAYLLLVTRPNLLQRNLWSLSKLQIQRHNRFTTLKVLVDCKEVAPQNFIQVQIRRTKKWKLQVHQIYQSTLNRCQPWYMALPLKRNHWHVINKMLVSKISTQKCPNLQGV